MSGVSTDPRNLIVIEAARRFSASLAAPSGAQVIEASGIGKSYEGRPIVSDFSIRIRRGDRIGIVGPVGVGHDSGGDRRERKSRTTSPIQLCQIPQGPGAS